MSFSSLIFDSLFCIHIHWVHEYNFLFMYICKQRIWIQNVCIPYNILYNTYVMYNLLMVLILLPPMCIWYIFTKEYIFILRLLNLVVSFIRYWCFFLYFSIRGTGVDPTLAFLVIKIKSLFFSDRSLSAESYKMFPFHHCLPPFGEYTRKIVMFL